MTFGNIMCAMMSFVVLIGTIIIWRITLGAEKEIQEIIDRARKEHGDGTDFWME